MARYTLLLIITLCYNSLNLSAQNVPTNYDAAKKIGDAKLSLMQRNNAPLRADYVVLKEGSHLNTLFNNENTIYVIDKEYDLCEETVMMPENSVLVIRKGNIKNGTILGNNAKYCIVGRKEIDFQLSGVWERIAPIYKASELGLKPDSKDSCEYNYSKLRDIIKKGYNLFIDGNYYISFTKPLILDYILYLYGGRLFFSRHALDLTENGGIFANGVHFESIEDKNTDDIVCGTREKHAAIATGSLTFLNCHFSCDRVVSLEFEYCNPVSKRFGIKSLLVKNCFADRNARFITLDVPYFEECSFKNNIFTNFTATPIYLAHNHSVRTHPNEANTNPWTEEIIREMCDVTIDSNIFIGREVSVYSYYCAALIIGKKCLFINNYLKDFVNYSDKNSIGYTAYDAYLSCVDVDYENNYVENVMSYSKDNAIKPQTEIGKSKINPLDYFNYKATRKYVNNVFVCDGNIFLKKGADKASLTCNIFNNVSPIDCYIWSNNSVIYKDIIIDGRRSSAKYGAFCLKDNYFECFQLEGNLIFSNSSYDFSDINISNNIFKITDGTRVVLFNQLYKDDYRRFSHGNINISDNYFVNTAPIYHFFIADTIQIKNNRNQKIALNDNLYLSDYTGNPRPLRVRFMDTKISLDAIEPHGGIIQFFSDESLGSFSCRVTSIPERGLTYHYIVGGKHNFKIVFNCNGIEQEVYFENEGDSCYYIFNGERIPLISDQNEERIWYKEKGVIFKSVFVKGDIQTTLSPEAGIVEGDYKLTYISVNV